MDEHSTSALRYGHLGRAIYQPETRAWTFSRSLAPSPRISYAGFTKTTVVSPLTAPQSSLIENKSLLPRVHPELAACWSLVDNETLSHAITTTSEACDPLTSSLFDLGNAVDIDNDDSGHRVVPIAMAASGECGNAISFRRLGEGTIELRHGMTARTRVPMVGDTECTEWSAGGAPVRQVCFARTVEERPTWAAARFPHSTIVFRPLYRKNPVSVHIHRDGDRVVPSYARNSRLDANPLVEISISQTGGFAHADVTFNPWYQKQLGIVDERGNWSVWEVSGRQRRSKGNWAATCMKSGSLPWLDLGDGRDINGHPRHDGWAAIEWAGNVSSFIVSDRRCPILYRIEGDEIFPYAIELGLKRKSEWILDVKRSTCNASQVFILTTSRIFWLDVSTVPVANSQVDDTRPILFPLLSWRHFRDPEDTTLRLSPFVVSGDFYLVLYSRLNHVTLAFHVPIAADGLMDMISIPDPFVLEVPSVSEDTDSEAPLNAAQFSTFVFREISHLRSGLSRKQGDPTMRLIKLFILDSRLAVRESIYVGYARGSEGAADDQQLSKDVLRLRRRYPGRRRVSNRSHDEFIVDDWDESVLSKGAFTVADSGISNITPLAIPQWATDYSSIYAIAAGKLAVSGEVGLDQGRSFQESIKELEASVCTVDANHLVSCRTMLDVLGWSPLLDDIDQNAQDFDDFFTQAMSRNLLAGSQFEVIFQPALDQFNTSSKSKLIDIYDRLINDWLSSLPHDIPGRTRIMKERIIRNVAAELILTQFILKRKPVIEDEALRSIEDVSHGNNSELPPVPASFDDSYPSAMGERRLPPPMAFPGDPGPQLATNQITAQNDVAAQEQGASAGTSGVGPVYSRLASTTSVNPKRSLSRGVANLLSHWQVGSDPATYKWQRTVQALEEEESQRTSKSTTPKRRLRKKTSQSTPLNSSQLPPESSAIPAIREWGSQPEVSEPSRIIRLQSSQAMEEDLPMTQIERGMFGGREASRKASMKARKKRRAAGF